ncbi:IS3 family transposase [Mycoavidus cysteinexigens]|uniref:IS3 family transposase n=1 Tax=Mycoavidus cysteinexigens TaxID=1553431 RepID=UPI003F68AFB8
MKLIVCIRTIHAQSDATYGMPRVRAELMEQRWIVSRQHVARLMRMQTSFIIAIAAVNTLVLLLAAAARQWA